MKDNISNVFLVRHGEATAKWGQDFDPGLSQRGFGQSEAVSSIFSERFRAPLKIISSPLLRARQTAAPLARCFDTNVEIDHAYQEIISPHGLAARQAWLKRFMGETWESQPQELLEWRMIAIESLRNITPGTVIYTHFMVINTLVGWLVDSQATVTFSPDNCSVTELKLEKDQFTLVKLGRELPSVVN